MMPMDDVHLIGMDRRDMEGFLANMGEKAFRSRQLWQWVYQKGAVDFSAMTSIAKPMRESLSHIATLKRPFIVKDLLSLDGTRKWLLRFADAQEAEMVFIPEVDRGTLCISSQVGCTLTCKFCHTGTQRLVRNLTVEEIVGQVILARDMVQDWSSPPVPRKITNIVLMGMGEPLYNYENVAKALKIIMDPEGIAISKRRITLSTSGVVPMMSQCGEELGVNLAVSLHATNNELRNEIVPLNKKYPIELLMEACRNYPGINNARRITFEYVMLKGVNDSLAEAKALVQLIKGIPSKVNLIPFNPWPGTGFERSADEQIQAFAEVVMKAGYPSPVRSPRGEDILAACGQLKSQSIRLKYTDRLAAGE
jgi:23S rRNA (adenine2503-C2)-methyltransferase